MKQVTDALGCAVLQAGSAVARRLSAENAARAGRALGSAAFGFSNRRRVMYADIKSALGPALDESARWKIVREHYRHLGQMLMETLRFPAMSVEDVRSGIKINNEQRFWDAVGEEKGVILLTAHFGNWELLQIVSGVLGKPMHVLARGHKHPKMDAYLNKLRESHGSMAIRRGMGVRDLLRGLRRNELIGVVGDQDAGKHEGVIVPLFGRKTTLPSGAFELAARTGAPLLPCFIMRQGLTGHEIFVGERIPTGLQPYEMEAAAGKFVTQLEDLVRRSPSQWLWGTKRWKYSWTKRILILSDGKPGHVKQSQAVAAQFQQIREQYGRPGMEYPCATLNVKFRSEWHRRLFPWAAYFMHPWIQGNLRRLRTFFDDATAKALEEASADFVISAGSSLVPLNLLLARDMRAKTIVLMKPSFPFSRFRYDLAIVPEHDRGSVPAETFRTLLAPGPSDEGERQAAAKRLAEGISDPEAVKFAVFLGGAMRGFNLEQDDVIKLLAGLQRLSDHGAGKFVLTTSRRTPENVCKYLKNHARPEAGCKLLVLANEDKRAEVVPGMMELAEILIVTEDSVSMISEAVASGKKVVVLSFGSPSFPRKHRRFREILERESAVVTASIEDLESALTRLLVENTRQQSILRRQQEALQKRLEAIL